MAWCVCESTKSTVEDFIQMKSNKIVKTGILTGSRLVWVFNSGCKSFFNLIREPVFYYLMIFRNGSNDKPVKNSNISLKLFELDLYYLMVIHWLNYWLRIHFWCTIYHSWTWFDNGICQSDAISAISLAAGSISNIELWRWFTRIKMNSIDGFEVKFIFIY